MHTKFRPYAASVSLLSLALILTLTLAARADAFIYWANLAPVPGTIGRANVDGTGADQSFITTGVKAPAGVASDGTYVYWANSGTNSIGRAFANGAEPNPKFITGALVPEGVAVDANHIYWANGDGTIGRANLDGTNVQQHFINTGAGDLNLEGVASDGAHLYWANQGANTIGLYNINSGGKFPNLITGAKAPVGVAVDNDPPTDQHVYWVNSATDTIGRANLDGSGVKQSFVDVGVDTNPRWVAVDDPDVYWTGAHSIGTVTVFRTMIDSIFIPGVHDPAGVAVDPTLGLGGAPPPSSPQCGDTITADTTLHHDLVNCPNNGIVIGADNITLNLNGHTIDGDGAPFSGCHPRREVCDVGVVNDGHARLTVTHGSVRGFHGGVGAGGNDNRLVDVSARRNRFYGLGIFGVAGGVVRNSSGIGSFAREGDGMILFGSHGVRVVHSSFRKNAHVGIVSPDSTGNSIKGNLFSRNGDEGFLMEGGKRNRLRRNRFVRNGGGITLGPGSHNVITRNRVSHGHDGIRIEKGHGNLVAHNRVSHARRAGIRLGISHPFFGGAHNLVRRNVVRNSRVDGFLVNAKDDHSRLKRNVAKRAGDDGFDIQSHSAKLARNHALRNGDLGIQAVRGVNDGGGNVARDNGDPRQCTNIACR
jgi:virginiamycin B lyase